MRLIRHGNTKRYRVVCPSCGCEFSFGEKEAITTYTPNPERYVYCMECNTPIRETHFVEE